MALQTAAAVAGSLHASNQAGANSRMRPSGSGDMEIEMTREALPMAFLFICLAVLAII